MKEIIQQLLAVEEKAKQIVAEAEHATRRVVAGARVEGEALVEERRQAASDKAQRLVAERAAQARAQKQARLGEAVARNRAALEISAPIASDAVETIFRAAIGL